MDRHLDILGASAEEDYGSAPADRTSATAGNLCRIAPYFPEMPVRFNTVAFGAGTTSRRVLGSSAVASAD